MGLPRGNNSDAHGNEVPAVTAVESWHSEEDQGTHSRKDPESVNAKSFHIPVNNVFTVLATVFH